MPVNYNSGTNTVNGTVTASIATFGTALTTQGTVQTAGTITYTVPANRVWKLYGYQFAITTIPAATTGYTVYVVANAITIDGIHVVGNGALGAGLRLQGGRVQGDFNGGYLTLTAGQTITFGAMPANVEGVASIFYTETVV